MRAGRERERVAVRTVIIQIDLHDSLTACPMHDSVACYANFAALYVGAW